MKKRTVIIPIAALAVVVPSGIFIAKKLDTSSTAPVISANTEDWTNSAVVSVTEAASFGGSSLKNYQYCVNSEDSLENCSWKDTSVTDIRVRNSGISYVWVRGIAENELVTDASNRVTVKVDRDKPEASTNVATTTSSIEVKVATTDTSGIASYMYSINDSDYVKGDSSYIFGSLTAGTGYTVKIKITDLAGNTKYITLNPSTNSVATTKRSSSKTKMSTSSMPTMSFSSHDKSNRPSNGKPTHSGGMGGREEQPSEDETPDEQTTDITEATDNTADDNQADSETSTDSTNDTDENPTEQPDDGTSDTPTESDDSENPDVNSNERDTEGDDDNENDENENIDGEEVENEDNDENEDSDEQLSDDDSQDDINSEA